MRPFRLAACMMLATALPLAAQQIQINKDNKTIAITTSGDASTLADIAVLTVGFDIYGKDQDETYANATKISNAIVAALTSAGIPKDGIQSTSQSLSPIDPQGNDDKTRYAEGLRFSFSQRWELTVPADQAAKALHIAVTSGANNSGGIEWKLQKDDALEEEAAKKALQHAHEVAERMAQGLGGKLGALIYASNQSPPRGIFAGMGFGNVSLQTSEATLGSARVNLKPLAISPERITRSATVYAVFAIE